MKMVSGKQDLLNVIAIIESREQSQKICIGISREQLHQKYISIVSGKPSHLKCIARITERTVSLKDCRYCIRTRFV